MPEIAAELSTKFLKILSLFLLILYALFEILYEVTVMLSIIAAISSEFVRIS